MKQFYLINPVCILFWLVSIIPGIAYAQPVNFDDLKKKEVASDPSIQWVQFGPGMGGFNLATYWHPTDPNVVLQSPNMGNSYYSTNKGETFQTSLNCDGSGINARTRGPKEMFEPDFSRQEPEFGFTTDKTPNGLWVTQDMGASWQKHTQSLSTFETYYLSAIAVDPNNGNIWFVGAGKVSDFNRILYTQAAPHGTNIHEKSQGKIWKSTNKGNTWQLKNSGLDPLAQIVRIIPDKLHPGTVYAATTYGFYQSTDNGDTWVPKNNGLPTGIIRSMTVHYDNTNKKTTLYVVDNVQWKANGSTVANKSGGVFKSVDKGQTWVDITGNLGLNLRTLNLSESAKSSYYKAIGKWFGISEAVAKTTYPDLPTTITSGIGNICVDPKNVNRIYVMNNYANNKLVAFRPGILWRTDDGGGNWYVSMRNGKNWNTGPDLTYWQNRNNPTGSNINIKVMEHWENRDDYERKSGHVCTYNADGSMFIVQIAKISLVSLDHGDTWEELDDVETSPGSGNWVGAGNSNVPGHGFYQDERFPGQVFCSSGENALWMTTDDGDKVRPGAQAAKYMKLLDEEHSVSTIAIHPNNKNTWYALFFRQAKAGQILTSTDAGVTWNSIGTPIPQPWPEPIEGGDQSVHQLSLIIDKNNPDNMYFCVPKSTLDIAYVGNSVTGQGIHKSTDGGKTWTEPNNGIPSSRDVTKIAFSPESYNTLYATVQGSGGGLFVSTTNGNNWNEVESTKSIKGDFGINDIHFAVNGKVYITAGYKNSPATGVGLWVSEDHLKTWKRIFDFPWVFRVETARHSPDTILISTLPNNTIELRNPGTYLSKDGGTTWYKINKGNGQSDKINDIAIDYDRPGRYYVSTYGSGWYMAYDTIISTPIGKKPQHTENTIQAFSNPGTDKLKITLGKSDEIKSVLLYTINGRVMERINIPEAVSELMIETANFSSGCLVLQAVTKNGNKIIKKVYVAH